MGNYDDISADELRAELLAFAVLIRTLDEDGTLLERTAELQRALGDLRRKLFAYEIRGAARLRADEEAEEEAGAGEADSGALDPLLRESLRVVEEALERERELLEGWARPYSPEDEDDD